MPPWQHELEFEWLGRAYTLSRARPGDALPGDRAARVLAELTRDDRRLRTAVAEWARDHGHVWLFGDELQIISALLLRVEAGLVELREQGAPERGPSVPRPAGVYRGPAVMPKPPAPMLVNEILDDARSLLITHCPPSFDPREGPLRVAYLLRALHGRPVELIVRSAAKPEPPLHRRKLSSSETSDGPGTLEWDGRRDDTRELVRFADAPLRVELLHDASYRDEAQTTVPELHERLHYAVPDFLRFDNNSALLVPAPWTNNRHPLAAIVRAFVALLDHPQYWLAVVGHTSARAGKASNQRLSEHRARGVRALVENDESAWVELAREHGSLRDVIAYLDYLARQRGWPCKFEGTLAELGTGATAQTRNTVSAFQSEYNARFAAQLDTDGVCGEQTLGAVFRVLYREFERWLAKLGSSAAELPRERVVYLGHGETLAGRAGGDEDPEAADRVLELMLVELPPFNAAITPAELYAIEDRRPFEIPNDDWASGPFTIVSDLTPEEPADPETYQLCSTDGSWTAQRVLPADGVVARHNLALRFEALPTELSYSLVVISHEGHRSTLFEGVPYGELWRVAQKRAES